MQFLTQQIRKAVVSASLLIVAVSSFAAGFTPTPAQIEQFKNLPPDTQRQLAKQYGIDIDSLKMGTTESGANSKKSADKVEQTVLPRGSDVLKRAHISDEDIEINAQGLKPFGYDLFAGEPNSFEPATNIPVPVDYVVGPSDTINVQLFGKINEKYELQVSRDGIIDFPSLGPISVAGVHFDDMKRTLQQRISKQIIGVESSITMGELRTMRIFVLGEAWRSGSYTVSSLATVTQALHASGGIKTTGSLRNIQVKRGGKLVTQFDLYDLLMDGDSSKDIRLQPGDVVFVPSLEQTVAIEGNVRRPAIYEIKSNDNANDLIRMAGGLLPDAYSESVSLDRVDNRRMHALFTLNLENDSGKNFKIKNGDSVIVGSISEQRGSVISLEGAVFRSGNYGWTSGMRLTDLIKSIDIDLWKEADLDYAIVVRERNIKREIDVFQVSIIDAISDRSSAANLLLQVKDRVLVFSKWNSNKQRLNRKITGLASDITQQSYANENDDLAFFRFRTDAPGSFDNAIEKDRFLSTIDDSARVRFEKTQKRVQTEIFEKELQLAKASREVMLKPILAQLRDQNKKGDPLAVVKIEGQVRYPGEYILGQATTVADLVKAAGGVTEAAYVLEAELTRTDLSNPTLTKIEHSVIDLRAAIIGDQNANLVLQSRDSLMIRQLPDWQKELKVELRGEFVFPGTYTFRRGETLSEVIKRAGGLTKYAFSKGAVFMREELREAEIQRLKQVQDKLKAELAAAEISSTQTGKGVVQDTTQAAILLEQVSQVQATGRLVINFDKVVSESGDFDIQLQPGDRLIVPTEKQSLTVVGEVQYPTSHLYSGNESINTYIDKSGGLTLRADDDRVYIIKADGSVQLPNSSFWFSSKTANLEAGDTVVVPLDTAYMRPLELWTAVTQIMYNSAVAIAAIGSL